jgi:hypothetical protein
MSLDSASVPQKAGHWGKKAQMAQALSGNLLLTTY